jgi:hypothetical protein
MLLVVLLLTSCYFYWLPAAPLLAHSDNFDWSVKWFCLDQEGSMAAAPGRRI